MTTLGKQKHYYNSLNPFIAESIKEVLGEKTQLKAKRGKLNFRFGSTTTRVIDKINEAFEKNDIEKMKSHLTKLGIKDDSISDIITKATSKKQEKQEEDEALDLYSKLKF